MKLFLRVKTEAITKRECNLWWTLVPPWPLSSADGGTGEEGSEREKRGVRLGCFMELHSFALANQWVGVGVLVHCIQVLFATDLPCARPCAKCWGVAGE